MSMSEKPQRTGRTANIAEKEQASHWLSSRPSYKPLLDNIIDFLNLHYRGNNKGWVNDGNAKFKFGPSNQNGRISIDPRPSKNGVNVRFGVHASNIPDYFHSKDLPQSLKPENCFNESKSYYDILLPLAGRNNEEFEAIKSFLKAGVCDGFVYTQENDKLYNEIQEQASEEDNLTYVRSAISEKICKRKEQQMERRFINWYKSNHPESDITQQYPDINFIRDVVIKIDSKVITAELKYKRTALEEIEAALAQLLRYGFYPDVEPSDEFWIVGSNKPTQEDTFWFQKLKENLWFELQYYYLNEDQQNFIKVS